MEQQLIQISKLEVNKGQIEGLPQNPRFIRDTRFEQLKKSIEDAPEMLNLRELIVMPHGKQYKERGGYDCGDDDRTIMNDNMGDSEFLDFLKRFCKAADEVMKPGAAFYIFHSDTEGLNFRMAVKETGWPLRECLIWEKNSLVLGRQDYQWIHEPALYGWKPGAGHNWYSDRSQTTVLHFDRPTVSKEHPTMKPVKLFAYLMGNSSKEGDIVLDSFGGSGTTLIAAEQLGRKARLMELDPHYCDVIIARWEKLTGSKAEILTSKQ